ncbi:MAG: NUDIX hydrolase [Candidatus Limimorpha sp.]
MYRLFCNNRLLTANNFCEEFLNNNKAGVAPDTIRKNIVDWLEGEGDTDLLDVDGCDLAMAIRDLFHQAPAAGGVVLLDDKIVAIDRNGIPDLPKGHIEQGETPETAALREVEEETGISDLQIIKPLPPTWHCYLLNGKWTIKKTSWFVMRSLDVNVSFKPQTQEGISKVFLTEPHHPDFLNNTFASIRFLMSSF